MLKVVILVAYFALMIGIGLYCRKTATDVNGFVLGGRSVGPWLTAFAYGTSYFSAVVFVGYAGQFGWKYVNIFCSDGKADIPVNWKSIFWKKRLWKNIYLNAWFS